MPTSKNFGWINFREFPVLKNFAWIYFREDRDFEKYFSLKKRKTTLLSSEQSLFTDIFFLCLKYAYKERKRVKIGKIRKHVLFESPPIPISSIADEFFKFILRGLSFADSHFSKILRGLIFAKSQKICEIEKFYPRENLIHAKINPRKVLTMCFICKAGNAVWINTV